MQDSKLQPSWNIYSSGIIVLIVICQIFRWYLFPFFIDIYYHLAVMEGFKDAGGYVTAAFWEFAPVGRPNLYPPFVHILMLELRKIGFSPLFIARLFDCISYPIILIALWFIISKIFHRRLAFFALVIFSSAYSFYLSITNIIPFSLALLLGLLAFFFIEKDKVITASLVLALSFYTHTLMSVMNILALILYGFLNRGKLRNTLTAIAAALILAFPLLMHQFRNREYFSFINVVENYAFEISLLVYIIALWGLIVAIKNKGVYCFPVALLCGMFPLALTHKMRYLSGQGMAAILFLAAVAIDNLYNRFVESGQRRLFKSILFVILFLFAFYLFNPIVYIDRSKPKDSKVELGVFSSSMIKNILPDFTNKTYATEVSIYKPKFMDEIVKLIAEHSSSDEIIYSNLSYAAGMFSVLSGRATSTAMLSEIKPFKPFDEIAASKLIIWLKELDNRFPPQLSNLVKEYKLEEVAQTQLAYIYKNPKVSAKKKTCKPFLSLGAVNSILFIFLGIIVWDLCARRIRVS